MLQHLKHSGFAHVIDFLDAYSLKTLRQVLDDVFTTHGTSSQTFKRLLLEQVDAYALNAPYIKTQIQDYLLHTSTLLCANHAGFENHPMLIASTLLSSVYYAQKGIHALPYCSCSALNPSNATAPTAIFTGHRQKDSLKRRSFRFTPASADKKTLYTLKNLSAADYNKIIKRIGQYDESCTDTLSSICHKCMHIDDLSVGANTKLIQTLHKFNTLNYNEYAANATNINPVFINQESFVTSLLIHDLDDDNAFISRLVDDKTSLMQVAYQLANKSNTWSHSLCNLNYDTEQALASARGTMFFYALEHDTLKPLKLTQAKGELFLTNATLSIKLDRKTLKHHLSLGTILPNLYICYATLYFTHNVRTAGGIFMTQYLKDMLDISASVMQLEIKDDFYRRNIIYACLMPFITVISDVQCRPLLLCDMAGSTCKADFINSVLDKKVDEFRNLTLCEMLYDFTNAATVEKLKNQIAQIQSDFIQQHTS